ncbi:MAG: Fic family protein [Coriobacteriia bacterium]|nr:Fic family protein [Coriobacteriia bacterium]
MREFNYENLPANVLSPEIVKTLAAIHEFRGKQDLYLEAHVDTLSTLSDVAKIQSIDASNRIEGIYTTDLRLVKLAEEKTTPRNRNEQEIAGYRDVLAFIHEGYDHIELSSSTILDLHRDLYRYTSASFAGKWKTSNNVIAQIDYAGRSITRFEPLAAEETPDAIARLCATYREALSLDLYSPLILLCLFAFDFSCIHPFKDGNGRMGRLLTLLLLYQSDYQVGKYISIEKLIEQSKDTYYDSLEASSFGWQDVTNDYRPFLRYMLGIIYAAYNEFSHRVEGLVINKRTKAQRIEMLFERERGKITKRDILQHCPDISETTVERTLANLLQEGKIKKIGTGRVTGYVKQGCKQ